MIQNSYQCLLIQRAENAFFDRQSKYSKSSHNSPDRFLRRFQSWLVTRFDQQRHQAMLSVTPGQMTKTSCRTWVQQQNFIWEVANENVQTVLKNRKIYVYIYIYLCWIRLKSLVASHHWGTPVNLEDELRLIKHRGLLRLWQRCQPCWSQFRRIHSTSFQRHYKPPYK